MSCKAVRFPSLLECHRAWPPVRSITSLTLERIWTGTLKTTNRKLLEEGLVICEISWFPDTTVWGVNSQPYRRWIQGGAIPSRRGTEDGPWPKEWSPRPHPIRCTLFLDTLLLPLYLATLWLWPTCPGRLPQCCSPQQPLSLKAPALTVPANQPSIYLMW